MTMDISPKTKEGIVDINIHEESHVEEIIKELMQRFGAQSCDQSPRRPNQEGVRQPTTT